MTCSTTATLDFSDVLLKTNKLIIELTVLLKEMRKAGMVTTEFAHGLDYDAVSVEEAHRTLQSVAFALDLIGSTANACINHEALTAFHETVEHVDRALQAEWVQSILADSLFNGAHL